MQKALKEKLEKVVELVSNDMVNPDIELDYEIPDRSDTDTDSSVEPYIVLTYLVNGTHTQKQKIPIKKIYMKKSAEEIANIVTFYIEQFMEQVESVESGAQ